MRHAAFAILILLKPVAAIQATSQPSPDTVAEQDDQAGDQPRIPHQLVMTAKQRSIDELKPRMRANVRRTLQLNPGLKLRFLSTDTDCRKFISENYGGDLLSNYDGETRGAYRGDLCRAAVIALEGGFYADLDMEFKVPFSSMVDNATTFMSAFAKDCDLLNAVFAAERGSEVMQSTLAAIHTWYKVGHAKHPPEHLMGPATLMRGLQNVSRHYCPDVRVLSKGPHVPFRVTCGPRQQFRLYREQGLKCKGAGADSKECPPGRKKGFEGRQFGIFEPGPERHLVAYSRFESCSSWGCNERLADQDRLADVKCT